MADHAPLVSALRLERLVSPHAALLAALHQPVFDRAGWSAESFAMLLGQPGVVGFLACREAEEPQPLGFILGRVTADEAEILTLAVADQARRQGVGQALVLALSDAVSAAGAQKIFLEVGESNHPARALYKKAGFTSVGKRPDYYAATGEANAETALIMVCHSESL